ncbi:HK97-gp10 family putative phage morphogenesis protein [Vibrio diabolicus]|uniref:HK97-gp10 family putative phage morphogenesis protein n=1 Tax=Vibrio diabolicus TaxID=50719 RepID=UPI0015F6D540|nr:HK97-gp10 family putative phage morphogenesis protein [Vibrio diabolicus]
MQLDSWGVSGLKELEKALTELGQKAGLKALRKASREAMGGVQLSMAMGAGYNSDSPDGEHMRDSIKISTKKLDSKHGGKDNALATRVGPSKKHSQKAIAQEYGTAKQAADPFMRPALYENRHRIVRTFRTVLATEIQKAIKKQAK